MFDVIMPLHVAKGDSLDLLRAASCVHSFVQTGTMDQVGQFHIVHPRGHSGLLQGVRALSPKVRCTPEEDMFSGRELRAIRTQLGWRRQQFVKLAPTRLSDADTWLTCDADVFALRGITDADMRFKRQLRMQKGKQFEEWVRDSFSLFGATPPEKLISVTPLLLAREGLETVQRLLDHPRRGWIEHLVDAARGGKKWTEYMVYQAANVAAGHWDRLHVIVKSNAFAQGVWRNHQPDAERIETIKSDSPPFFVYQSVREDFFAAQDILDHFGLASSHALPTPVREELHLALLKLHEAERYWGQHLTKEFGLFQSRFYDPMQARVAGQTTTAPGDGFELATILFFIAISQIEKTDLALAPKQLIPMALERMRAQPFLATLIDGDPRFAEMVAFLLGEGKTMPAGFDKVLYVAEISRKTMAIALQRLTPRHAELAVDIAVTRARYGRAPAFKAVSKIATTLVDRGDWGQALRLLRMMAPRYGERQVEVHALLATLWERAGKPAASVRSRRRSEAAMVPAQGSSTP